MAKLKRYNSTTGQWETIIGNAAGSGGGSGSQGAQGIQGTQGLQGETGSQGSIGTQGQTGNVGGQGVQGIQGVQGPSGGGGLTDYNFTFSSLANNTTTFIFTADQRCYQRVEMTAGATINFQINNSSDNYVRFYNSSASDITLAIGTVTLNGVSIPVTVIPDDTVSVKAGKYVEIGVVADSTECDITISSGLKRK